MDEFSYIDIFATKGIEYLIIITFLVLLIPFWIILNQNDKIVKQIKKVIGNLSFNMLRIPQGLFYSKNHTWMHMEKTGTAKLGLDDLLMHITGEVKFSHLKNPGDKVTKGDLLAEIDQSDKNLRIFSPVSGKIVATNTTMLSHPEILSDDPYGNGWIYRIKPSNWMSDVKSCYFADDATNWSARELERFKDFVSVSMRNCSSDPSMVIMQDGGELVDHSLSAFPEGVWKNFEEEFLTLS